MACTKSEEEKNKKERVDLNILCPTSKRSRNSSSSSSSSNNRKPIETRGAWDQEMERERGKEGDTPSVEATTKRKKERYIF